MPFAEASIDIPILFAAISSLSLPVAVVGFAVGAYFGSLNRTTDPNLPLALGVILGAVSYAIAEALVIIAGVLLIGGLIIAAIVFRPVIERTLDTFAQSSGRRFATRHFTARGEQVTDEFSERQAFLDRLPIEAEQRERLSHKDRTAFCRAIERLGSQYPYVPDEVPGATNSGLSVEDFYGEE